MSAARLLRWLLALTAVFAAAPALAGGLFVAGRDSRSVLEFDAGDGSLARVFVETLDEGFQNPGGIALHPADGSLYVTSRGSGEIWRYDTPSGDVLPPAVAAGLFRPGGADFDAAGDFLYFSDSSGALVETADAVRRLEIATGTVATVGSTSQADFGGVAVAGGFVYASDTDGDRIVRFPVGGGNGTAVISSGLDGPRGLLLRSATQLVVADTGSDRVLEFSESGGSWSFDRVVLDTGSGVGDPCGLALAPGGALSVTGCASDDVVQVDLVTLAVGTQVDPGAGGLASPKDAVWSGATLLVASPVANAVLYFDLAGDPTGTAARGVTTQIDASFGFSDDGSRLAVASASEGDVVEYDADTGALLRVFGSVCFLPSDVAYGPGGDLYTACLGGNEIVRIDGASGAVLGPFVLGGSGGLVAPSSLAFGPNGNLFVSSASGEVLEFDGSTGVWVRDFVDATGNGSGALDPRGFRFHAGTFYLTSEFTDELRSFDAATGAFLTTLVAGGDLDAPSAVDVGTDGKLYVASSAEDGVRRYAAADGAPLGPFVAPGAGGLDSPVDLAFRPLPEPADPGAWVAALALVAGLRR